MHAECSRTCLALLITFEDRSENDCQSCFRSWPTCVVAGLHSAVRAHRRPGRHGATRGPGGGADPSAPARSAALWDTSGTSAPAQVTSGPTPAE